MKGRMSKVECRMSRRRGVTIMEVLFAIMVTAVGLMGALTLLPVAATVARKARTTDAATTAVTAAVGDFDTKGMRIPARWIGYDEYWDLRTIPPKPNTRNFQHLSTMALPFGMSICIDPRGIAANDQNPDTRREMSTFPYQAAAYNPLTGPPRMFRVTLNDGSGTGAAMGGLLANSLFTFDDDVKYNRPNDNSIVAGQTFDMLPGAATTAGRRQIDGQLSWMATLVPKMERYTLVPNDQYVLSIVVFHQRPVNLGRNPDTNNSPLLLDPKNERVLTVAAMPGAGILGGEVLLQTPAATQDEANEELGMHTNDWIMLSGRIQHAVNLPSGQPRMVHVFKWYRVSDLEFEVAFNGALGERWVTLSGQDWEVPIADTEAVAVEGVVAVVEKTVRLENGQ